VQYALVFADACTAIFPSSGFSCAGTASVRAASILRFVAEDQTTAKLLSSSSLVRIFFEIAGGLYPLD